MFRFNFNQFLFYRFAHGNEKDGFKMFEEKFLRETIRNFPYKQCPLLQQLVRLIAPISLVSFIRIFSYKTFLYSMKQERNILYTYLVINFD